MLSLLLLTWLGASIPSGLILTTLAGVDTDLRTAGSGNIGATNVARLYGWKLALPVLLWDMAKGFGPVLLASSLFPSPFWFPQLVVVAAFVGHCFSAFLDFRGGKGVATTAGGLLALSPWVTLPAIAVWGALFALTGRSSVAALVAACSLVGLALYIDPPLLMLGVLMACAIGVTHISNIRRIWRGEESAMVKPVLWNPEQTDLRAALEQGPGGFAVAPLWPGEEEPEQG